MDAAELWFFVGVLSSCLARCVSLSATLGDIRLHSRVVSASEFKTLVLDQAAIRAASKAAVQTQARLICSKHGWRQV